MQDVILEEIRKLRGLPKEVMSPSTCEVGVMCELIPSPAVTHHASTLGLDRSARRYHSVLSRPLSPEPSPLRRRTKKQLLAHSKARNTDKRHLRKAFTERVVKKRSQSQSLKNVECGIKPKNEKDIFSKHSYQNSQEEDSQISVAMADIKIEPSGAQTIVVSDQISVKTEKVENENRSNLKSLRVSKGGSSLATSPVKDGDGKKPDERTVHSGVIKDNGCLENITNNDCLHVRRTRQKMEGDEEKVSVEDEPLFGHEEASTGPEELQETQNSSQVKFKFSCKICSYKSMRENHFLKHMQLHDKVCFLFRTYQRYNV